MSRRALGFLRRFVTPAFIAPTALSASLALFAGAALSTGTAGCDETGGTGGAGGGGVGGYDPPRKICLDKTSLQLVPPAGLKIGFRVLDDLGSPVRPLTFPATGQGDVTVINDAKGLPFGASNEGDSVSGLGTASELELYSVLVLDFSDSIVNQGLLPKVLEGARAYVAETVTKPDAQFKHKVAIVIFGKPESIILVQDFTNDDAALETTLGDLADSDGLGTTDLYDAYISSLNLVDLQGSSDAVVERFLVLISDGTHEAGAEEFLRGQAMAAKKASPATKYTIGIRGDYDACKLEELAGAPESDCGDGLRGCREGLLCDPAAPQPPSCTQFQPDVDQDALAAAFQDIAARAAGIARSNYVVGVCTPVALGTSSVTVKVDVDGAVDQATLPYNANKLTGDLANCDATEVRDTMTTSTTTGSGGGGGGGVGGGGGGVGGAGGGGGAGGN
jgi:hypothetical protein